MAYFERVRDVVSGPFSPDVIQQRMAAGWQMVSIEWRRELPDSEAPPEGGFSEDIPFGLRISMEAPRSRRSRKQGPVDDDGSAGSGLFLLGDREHAQRVWLPYPGRQAMDACRRLQHDAAPH